MDERLQQLIEEMDGYRERYQEFCRSLSLEELARPVPQSAWTVKGYIAHLATIDRTVQPWFEALAAGKAPGGGGSGERFDIDAWNESQVEKRAERTVEELLAEMDATRASLRVVLEGFTSAVLDGTMHFGGDRDRAPAEVPLYEYLRAWVRHDPAHTLDMLRALPERANDDSLGWARSMRFDDLDPRIVPPRH